VDRLDPSLNVKISTREDSPKFQGFPPGERDQSSGSAPRHSPRSSRQEPRVFHKEIASAVAAYSLAVATVGVDLARRLPVTFRRA